jgi:phosphoribosyl-AMP cyclohydrolase
VGAVWVQTARQTRDNGGVEQDDAWPERIRRNEHGLFPAVVQEASSGAVLMLAWMDDEALRRTLESRRATYWSRSRQQHWVKGETSGHVQHVREVRLDCDADTVLLVVDQHGPACHTGTSTCFDADLLLRDLPGG